MLPDSFWNNERELLYEILFPIIYGAAIEGAVSGMETVSIGLDWALINTAARDWARTYTYDLVKGITETSQGLLQQPIADWIESGAPLDALIDQLAQDPVFSGARASLVASTEVTRAFAQGNLEAWRASGVVDGVRWEVAGDDLVCPICSPLQNKEGTLTGGVDGLFPPAHPACRCWIQPIVNT